MNKVIKKHHKCYSNIIKQIISNDKIVALLSLSIIIIVNLPFAKLLN